MRRLMRGDVDVACGGLFRGRHKQAVKLGPRLNQAGDQHQPQSPHRCSANGPCRRSAPAIYINRSPWRYIQGGIEVVLGFW